MVWVVMIMKMNTQVRKVVFKESWDWRDFTDNSNEISITHHLQRVLTQLFFFPLAGLYLQISSSFSFYMATTVF